MIRFTEAINSIVLEAQVKDPDQYELVSDEDLSKLPEIIGIHASRLEQIRAVLFESSALLIAEYGEDLFADKSLMSEVLEGISLRNNLALSNVRKCNNCFLEAIAEYGVDIMLSGVTAATCVPCGGIYFGWSLWKLIKAQNDCGCI